MLDAKYAASERFLPNQEIAEWLNRSQPVHEGEDDDEYARNKYIFAYFSWDTFLLLSFA
jgi:hypothetical protein